MGQPGYRQVLYWGGTSSIGGGTGSAAVRLRRLIKEAERRGVKIMVYDLEDGMERYGTVYWEE